MKRECLELNNDLCTGTYYRIFVLISMFLSLILAAQSSENHRESPWPYGLYDKNIHREYWQHTFTNETGTFLPYKESRTQWFTNETRIFSPYNKFIIGRQFTNTTGSFLNYSFPLQSLTNERGNIFYFDLPRAKSVVPEGRTNSTSSQQPAISPAGKP